MIGLECLRRIAENLVFGMLGCTLSLPGIGIDSLPVGA